MNCGEGRGDGTIILCWLIAFVYNLQTQREEDEQLPQEDAELKDVDMINTIDGGMVNPGIENSNKYLIV